MHFGRIKRTYSAREMVVFVAGTNSTSLSEMNDIGAFMFFIPEGIKKYEEEYYEYTRGVYRYV